mgnify:CR=1 FL=1
MHKQFKKMNLETSSNHQLNKKILETLELCPSSSKIGLSQLSLHYTTSLPSHTLAKLKLKSQFLQLFSLLKKRILNFMMSFKKSKNLLRQKSLEILETSRKQLVEMILRISRNKERSLATLKSRNLLSL